jgi:hypothetical protein
MLLTIPRPVLQSAGVRKRHPNGVVLPPREPRPRGLPLHHTRAQEFPVFQRKFEMSTAGQFDDDAFISYGSIDNQLVEDKEKAGSTTSTSG